MPRRRRTQSGEPAQKLEPVEGQGYGQAAEQTAMQQALPAPATHGATMAPVAQPLPGSAPPGVAGAPQQPPVDLAALLGQAPIGLLGGTRRPGEAVTAGLPTGPGPGPRVGGTLNPATPLGRTLRLLAERTGDPLFRDLADRAGL